MQNITSGSALWRKSSLSLFCSVFFAAGSHSANAASYYVNDNNTAGDIYTTAVGSNLNSGTMASPYLSIQSAIDAASSGDTIYVDAGTYNENVSVDKSLTLLGAGSGATIIDGDNNGSGLGTIFLPVGGNNIQIGAMGQGFHVIGIDGPPGIEKAAIYLDGTQTNITIIDNEIEARGDAGLMGEYNATNNNVIIDNNHFTGQTFNGANPAGQGSGAQFTLPNVPRQAVVFGGGSSTTNTMNFTFTNNVISTVTGGQSITDNSGNPIAPSDQGNMLVTLDLVGTNLIQGNTFDGTTVSWYAALRTRGTGYTIDNNIFNGSYLVGMATGSNAVDASLNYWGDASGANNPINNPCGLGVYVPNNVTLAPFYKDASLTTTSNGAPSVSNITQNTSFCSIQAAVDAANPTDTIVASAGKFTEQVEISKDLVLMGQGKGVTTILGSANMPLFFTTSGDNYPIVYVHDAANVIIKDLTVDGDGKGNSNYRYQGVGYSNAGGTLDNIEVTSVIETPFNGNQHGIGLFADASNGIARTLTLKNSMIRDCQKNAISLSGADLTANVNDNIITGAGAIGTPLPAQNGIQFYGTAGGEIKNNVVKGFWYTPTNWTATGMLLYSNTGNIDIDGNDLDSNDAHIYDFNGDATITNNDMKSGNYGVIAYANGTNVNAIISGNSVMDVVTGIGIYEASGTSISATINENSITNISDKAIESGAAATLDATCNWYGTTDDAAIQALLNGPINYTPFLNNGTDNNATAGFQPVPGSCVAPSSSDDLLIVSDAGWMMSTEVNLAEAGGYPWKGVSSLPATATYTLPAVVGQPYHYHSIDSVDGARTLRADNGVTFFRTTFNLAVDTGVAAHIISRMDDGMEIYINGHMIAREDDRTNDNWNGLPHNLILLQNGDQGNGHNGDMEFDIVNNYRLDSVVVAGENELVIALRNAPQTSDKGGFSFRMELKTGEAYMPELTGYLVSDVEWEKSTSTTAGGTYYIWNGTHSLPAGNTYTEDAELGQPYGWYSTEEIPGSFAIKTGSDVTYHRRRFTIVDSADVNVRLRATFDEAVMVYVNDVLIASDFTSDLANRSLAAHDVMFVAGGAITNGNAGGDMFEQVENVDFNNILKNGDNYITVVLRNKANNDKGGFSLRLDLDKAGNPVIRKTAPAGGSSEENADHLQVNFDIYPNPTNGMVFIDLKESPSADNSVTVLDLNGKVIMNRSLVNPQTGMMDIDLSDLANGMYIIRIKSGDQNYQSKRVMKL
ncbi:T9SS type A sorting domain-containing protein [Owenweeksia hongkongensis]|uniref:T9SS type A sorting domain-containing protein n=1 Tax=Owenweeksia hongkongensis TaxID=253245 RepID=UPI003A90EBA4